MEYQIGPESFIEKDRIFKDLRGPVLVVSNTAGRGNVSVAEAVLDLLPKSAEAHHIAVEELLPKNAVAEDLLRYKFISDKFPFLLNFVYRLPVFYLRKLIREKIFNTGNMAIMREKLIAMKIRTVIGISHRPTFWMSAVKKKEGMNFELWGVLTEFGESLGWRYIFWDVVNGYVAPFDRKALRYPFPPGLKYVKAVPFCRRAFRDLSGSGGDRNKVLFMAGFWGQIFFEKARNVLFQLLDGFPDVHLYVVCGTNKKLHDGLRDLFGGRDRINIFGKVDNVSELMKACASIVTKPGFSTIVEAHNSGRQIFLLRGMPVAEDNNASYAISNYGARWFSADAFREWYFDAEDSWGGIRKETVGCPLCGSAGYSAVEKNYDRITDIAGVFSLVKCDTCGLLYVNPRPSSEALYRHFYPDNYPAYLRTAAGAKEYGLSTTYALIGIYYRLRKIPLFKELWRMLLNPLRTRGEVDLRTVDIGPQSRVLDIGCGTGIFLDHLRWLTGCGVSGIELNDTARDAANRLLGRGTVPAALLEKNDFKDRSFDLVTMWLVFEHLVRPMDAMKEVSRLVKDGGWFVMAVPNINSWWRKIFKGRWSGLDLPRHLQFPTTDTARIFMENNGFTIKRIKYGSSHILASLQLAVTGRRYAFGKQKKGLNIEENIFLRCLVWPLSVLAAMFHGSDIIIIYSQRTGRPNDEKIL